VSKPQDPVALTKNEDLFRLLVESVGDYAIFVLDPTGHVATWNAGAQRIKGYAASEIIGQHFSRFYPEDDAQSGKCERELEEAVRSGRFEEEGWRVRKDGSRFWANVIITPLFGHDQKLVGFAKVTRDLTERRAREEQRVALAQAEAMNRTKDEYLAREREARRVAEEAQSALATTLRSIGDAVIATDAEGRVTMMNGVAEALTEWTEAEAVGAPLDQVFRIVNEQSRAVVESPAARVLRDGVIVGLANHTVLIGRRGTETPIDDSGAPIRGENGAIRGVVLVFRSASEEKKQLLRRGYLADVATELAASRDYRATLTRVAELAVPRLADWCSVNLIEEGSTRLKEIAVAHADPKKLEIAREWARRFPPEPDGPRGVPNVIRTGVSELYADIPDALLVESAKNDEHLQILRALRLRSVLVAPIVSGTRVLGAITLVMAESTRRYEEDDVAFAEELGRRAGLAIENAMLFEAAEASRRVADAANRTKDEFLATVSHELRTPLNAILGWATLMATPSIDEAKRKRGTETIARNATAMAKLIEDLLDVSRIMSGKMRLELARVEVVPVLEAAIDATKPAADAKQIVVRRTLGADLAAVQGDASRIQQIAWNLLSNAVKFTPPGGHIEITARGLESAVELTVKDDGRGIDPSFLPHVFEPFRQADSSMTRSAGGLGLGLSITKQLVELHGGHIAAKSDGLGRGATFTVHLPRAPSAPVAAPSRSAISSRARKSEPADLNGCLVLIVDDEPDARILIQTVLEHSGARVAAAASAAEAIALLENEVPTVLVSDIGMPGENGYDLMRRIRALPGERGGKVPSIALTAYARTEDRMQALSAGFMVHLAKPVDPAKLTAAVAALAAAA
jgi:PAS domain S-box-containing protein